MALHRFSTDNYRPSDRLAVMHDLYAAVERIEIEPIGDGPIYAAGVVRELPGVTMLEASYSPCISRRTAAHVADGADNFVFCMLKGGAFQAAHGLREAFFDTGDAYLGRSDRPSEHRIGLLTTTIDIVVPRLVLDPLVEDAERATRSRLRSDATRLLAWYAEGLLGSDDAIEAEAASLCANHLIDLVAMAVGARRDAAHIAAERGGLRAARLARAKADIAIGFARPGLTAEAVAARQGISTQYLRALLASDGTSFSDLILTHRLRHAARQLGNPGFGRRNISDIAYASGFGDLSYFNRAFRRHFGMTPKEFRGGATPRPASSSPRS